MLRGAAMALPIALFALAWSSCQSGKVPPPPVDARAAARGAAPSLTHGIVAGDVTPDGAIAWARASGPGWLWFEVGGASTQAATVAATAVGPFALDAERDFTAQAPIRLATRGRTIVRARLAGPGPRPSRVEEGMLAAATASVAAAPAAADARPLRIVWAGDLGGQRYCRRVGVGYAIFDAILARAPDLFVMNGDAIYADDPCPADGPVPGWRNLEGGFPDVREVDWSDRARVREVFAAHWRYHRADEALIRLLSSTPVVAQWDDHEVVNDFGGGWGWLNGATRERAGYPTVVDEGRAALFAWWPIAPGPREEPRRLYRRFRWGADVELFIVDARSYRSRNDDPDHDGKTMLGAAQRAWLIDALASSTAAWKLVSVDVPISVPTGARAERFGRDGWANGTAADFSSSTGFERELATILGALEARRVSGLVFLATDVHHAELIRYEPDLDGDGRPFVFHELLSGPLSAVRGQPKPLDPTFRPRSLWAEGDLFNFGELEVARVDGRPRLTVTIRDERGAERPGSRLTLTLTLDGNR